MHINILTGKKFPCPLPPQRRRQQQNSSLCRQLDKTNTFGNVAVVNAYRKTPPAH